MAYNYGSRNLPRLKEVLWKTALLTGCIGLGTLTLCYMFRGGIIALFLKDAAVAEMGERYSITARN